MSFPKLTEITDYLLLYRVHGLKTLRNLFPNLAVIRGQRLFYNYALVLYEMMDMEDIGLIGLKTIMRGAVRLTKNRKLCYINTINWNRITNVSESEHQIINNKAQEECVDNCPESCNDREGHTWCWTAKHCQLNLRKNVDLNSTFFSSLKKLLPLFTGPLWKWKLGAHWPSR